MPCVALLVVGAELPVGNQPAPVPVPHFPDGLHAFVWRNWELVPAERMAEVVGATPQQMVALAAAMGLPAQPVITDQQWKRSYITIIRRNWHLLPYEQLTRLLGMTNDELAFTLREDDFLYYKLGGSKPLCEPIRYAEPDGRARAAEERIRQIVKRHFPGGLSEPGEPLFEFVKDLSTRGNGLKPIVKPTARPRFSPRYCYSYFAPYGDPLLEPELDPYPDGLLAKLSAVGADGVWLQGVLYKLAPFLWDPALSDGWEKRLAGLRDLVARAKRHGIGIYLYLNEPRAMPLPFFERHPELKGVVEGDHATLCTSTPEVREWLEESVARIFREVPGLAGAFTITASENLTSCWSHYGGAQCPRCAGRTPAEVIAEVNAVLAEGVRRGSDGTGRLIAWDWGWDDAWADDAIRRLPKDVWLQSVSEWSLPIERGGVASTVGEYSISSVGPGPRALHHWAVARECGLKTSAKTQMGCTWELSAVPYIPAVELVARHACNLCGANVDGLMLGWTLGGYPSPNLEVVKEASDMVVPDPEEAMARVARRRFGDEAPKVVDAWRAFSKAFAEFPFHIGTVYSGPQHAGPSNLLYLEPTGHKATMVGFPYDDLDGWRSIYPPEVFTSQLDKVARGFLPGLQSLREALADADGGQREALTRELQVAEACYLHFRSSADQCRFVTARATTDRASGVDEMRQALTQEIGSAVRLYYLQRRDSRIGFEASNHYFYVPLDLVEKVINCEDLLDRLDGAS